MKLLWAWWVPGEDWVGWAAPVLRQPPPKHAHRRPQGGLPWRGETDVPWPALRQHLRARGGPLVSFPRVPLYRTWTGFVRATRELPAGCYTGPTGKLAGGARRPRWSLDAGVGSDHPPRGEEATRDGVAEVRVVVWLRGGAARELGRFSTNVGWVAFYRGILEASANPNSNPTPTQTQLMGGR